MTPPTIDPGVVTLIQSTFLEQIGGAFSTTASYASRLMYLFATIELAILGLAWALQRDVGWDKFFFKIIKIGLIYSIIQNYAWLLTSILNGFAQLAGVVINDASIAEYIFNPAKIWQYGYDVGVHMLQLAASSNLIGLSLIQVSLGLGILLTFGLLGIQMIIQTIGFYLVSFGSLILLPFGALGSAGNMFDKAIQAVLKAGLRLMALIIIVGIAVTIWKGFDFIDLTTTTNFNLNQPLGLFFTALLFLCLAIYLPKVVSEAVGDVSSSVFESSQPIVATVRESATTFTPTITTGMSNMQAATTIAAGASGTSYEGVSSTASAASMPTTTSGTQVSSNLDSKTARDSMTQASILSKSISESTVKKIKEVVSQAIKEKK